MCWKDDLLEMCWKAELIPVICQSLAEEGRVYCEDESLEASLLRPAYQLSRDVPLPIDIQLEEPQAVWSSFLEEPQAVWSSF